MKPITPENNTLGFVGVGYMGRPIAQRLLESGFKLIAHDRERRQAEQLLPFGGRVAESVAELSSSCDVVLSCLPSDEAVLSTYSGPDGAFANAHSGSLVIDMSTVYPETAQQLARLASERGVGVLRRRKRGCCLFSGAETKHASTPPSLSFVRSRESIFI